MAVAETTSGLYGGLAARRAHAERAFTFLGLGGILLIAFALRFVPVLLAPSLNWADEVFQATEQAHRLVYGYGLVPWEFRLGVRSWLLPGTLAGLMEFARLFGDGPEYYLPVIGGACSLLALAPVACCFLWCRRWFGPGPALVGAFAVAVAPELVYFGPRTLSEAVAGHLLVLGTYLLAPGFRVASRHRLFAAGALLALTCMIRIQLAPAVPVIVPWALWRAPRRELAAFAAGTLLVFAGAALLDKATIGYPLASVWRYVIVNLYDRVSSTFGTEPWYWYGLVEWAVWGPALWAVLILAVLGSRRNPLPLVAAAIIVATHSLIAHKEYRFIYPALVLIAVQAGLGLAELAAQAEQRFSRGIPARAALAGAIALSWFLVALTAWSRPALATLRRSDQDHLATALFVARAQGICGIVLYDTTGRPWGSYGGYTYLHQPVPLFWTDNASRLRDFAQNANVLLYARAAGSRHWQLPAQFSSERCFARICVARRPGHCLPAPMQALPFPAPLKRLEAR